ncbi:hypothetical protein Aple_081850 [Acrocarpospora pleiomorpha]|uniref:Uncharacterized protein n=1 Tax=Acrocarpospora pleiomorpha TaxID=90975 RepID=A0A5M3XWG0_9ACTN|nr:collagen-like protein [Acrocarpospora pleiomorpha]GES25286.1 hypothetical protein Aple_081850 [Acrocarpospora pleiomorpha]
MSSVLLYLAIVAMWLGVLVPMWLRRDRYVYVDDEKFTVEGDTLTEPLPAAHEPQNPDALSVSEPLVAMEPKGSDEGSPGLPGSRGRAGLPGSPDQAGSGPATEPVAPADSRRAEWRRRARITARRRRRLLWSVLLFLASVVTAAVQIVPWWGVAPSAVVLIGYLAVLRVAVSIDAEQRELAARAQASRARHARELRRRLEEAAREAEIIEIEARRRVQVFDQYADHRRAVGD